MDSRPLSDEPDAQSMTDELRNRHETGDGDLCDQIVSERGRKVFRQIGQAIKNQKDAFVSQEQYDKMVAELAKRRHIVLENVPDQYSSSQDSSSFYSSSEFNSATGAELGSGSGSGSNE